MKSKKRSAANSLSTPPDLVFFIDECLGTGRVPEALRQAGAHAVSHQSHFENRQGIKDEEWPREIGERGWIVLTKDKNFTFVDALPRIRRLCARNAGPFIARITRLAEVDIVEVDD